MLPSRRGAGSRRGPSICPPDPREASDFVLSHCFTRFPGTPGSIIVAFSTAPFCCAVLVPHPHLSEEAVLTGMPVPSRVRLGQVEGSLGAPIMPAADRIRDAVKNALVKDGWTITADPYVLEYEEVILF